MSEFLYRYSAAIGSGHPTFLHILGRSFSSGQLFSCFVLVNKIMKSFSKNFGAYLANRTPLISIFANNDLLLDN